MRARILAAIHLPAPFPFLLYLIRAAPLAWAAAGAAAGLLLADLIPHPPVFALAIGVAAAAAAMTAARARRIPRHEYLAWFLAFAAVAALAAALLDLGRSAPSSGRLGAHDLPARNVILEATLAEDPERAADRPATTVLLEARRLSLDGGALENVRGRVRASLRWRDFQLKYGDLVRLTGNLRRSQAPSNPGQSDFRVWLRAKKIDALITCWSGKHLEILGHGQGDPVKSFLLNIRRQAVGHLRRFVGPPESEVLVSMLFGNKAGIPAETLDAFRRTGVVHVLVTSGLHVGLLAWLSLGLLGLAGVSSRKAAALTLPVLIFYLLLCGARPPLVRSTLMFSLMVAARMLGRGNNSINAIGAAALVVLLTGPEALWDLSFQFSFAATFAIVCLVPWVAERRGPVPRPIAQLAGCTLAAQLALLPFLASSIKSAPLFGALANFIVIPAMGAYLATGFVLAVLGWLPGAGVVLGSLLKLLLALLLEFVDFIASVPLASVTVPPFSVLSLLAYVAWGSGSLAWVAASRATRQCRPGHSALESFEPDLRQVESPAWPRLLTFTGAAALAILIWRAALAPQPAELSLTFFDVGQGMATAIRLPSGRTVLFDAGPPFAGQIVVAPALKAAGVGRLAAAVISHPHTDHAGGIEAVLRRLPTDFVCFSGHGFATSSSFGDLVSFLRVSRQTCRLARDGVRLTGEPGVEMRFLHPPAENFASGPRVKLVDENSTVLLVTFGGTAALLPSDIRHRAEAVIASRLTADRLRNPGRDTLFQASHHGSASGNSARLLSAVRPRIAIVSTGRSSRSPLPHPAAVIRLKDHGAAIWTTARHGAIRAVSDGRRWRVFPLCPPARSR